MKKIAWLLSRASWRGTKCHWSWQWSKNCLWRIQQLIHYRCVFFLMCLNFERLLIISYWNSQTMNYPIVINLLNGLSTTSRNQVTAAMKATTEGLLFQQLQQRLLTKWYWIRVQPVLDSLLRPNQNGFRWKRSTITHILALRSIIENLLIASTEIS